MPWSELERSASPSWWRHGSLGFVEGDFLLSEHPRLGIEERDDVSHPARWGFRFYQSYCPRENVRIVRIHARIECLNRMPEWNFWKIYAILYVFVFFPPTQSILGRFIHPYGNPMPKSKSLPWPWNLDDFSPRTWQRIVGSSLSQFLWPVGKHQNTTQKNRISGYNPIK